MTFLLMNNFLLVSMGVSQKPTLTHESVQVFIREVALEAPAGEEQH